MILDLSGRPSLLCLSLSSLSTLWYRCRVYKEAGGGGIWVDPRGCVRDPTSDHHWNLSLHHQFISTFFEAQIRSPSCLTRITTTRTYVYPMEVHAQLEANGETKSPTAMTIAMLVFNDVENMTSSSNMQWLGIVRSQSRW